LRNEEVGIIGIHEKHVVGADGFQVRFVNDVKVRTEPRPCTMLHEIGKAGEISLPIFVAWVRPNRNDEITATTAGCNDKRLSLSSSMAW